MLFLGYLILRPLVRFLAGKRRSTKALEIENAVLRHQLEVLRRTNKPKLSWFDRMILTATSRVIPRERWKGAFVISPQTLLRWHRELVKRRWSYPHRTPGRPTIDPELRDLIVRVG